MVGVKAFVLEGHEGLRNVIRKGLHGHRGPPFQADLGYEPSVMAQDLAGLLGLPGRYLGD
jgi:hypothetical protein